MYQLKTYDKLNSTNKFSLENIKKIEKNTVIRAKIQENGRGRFDRKWISDKENNCYISFVLKPDIKYKLNFPNLTQYLSVILCRELTNYGLIPSIKWPNDVQINGKKIAGILSEISFNQSKLNGIILGIGVNLNLTEEDIRNIDIPATSLNIETGKNINSEIFIEGLSNSFFKEYESFIQKGFRQIRAEYISYCNFIGKEIKIKNPEVQTLGIALNVCADGMLEILDKNNEIKKIISGDVVY